MQNAARLGSEIIVLPRVDSTNRYAKEMAAHGAPEGTLVLTEWQYGGYGRNGRAWQTAPGDDIAMSWIMRPQQSPQHAGEIALFASIAVRRAIERQTALPAAIKWPNDVWIGEKKCCGILAEMATMGNAIAYIVLGIGLNVNTTHFDGEVADTATSLYRATGQAWDRNAIVAAIREELADVFGAVWTENRRAALIAECRRHSAVIGRRATLIDKHGKHAGTVLDIAENGGLLLAVDGGETRQFLAGDASVLLDANENSDRMAQ